MLCFLHGAGEAATQDTKGIEPQLLNKLLVNGSPAWHADNGSAFISPFLVVCPQLERRRRWEQGDALWVDRLVKAAVRDFEGDDSRLILTGFSYGGEGAFQVVAGSRLKWSTIWVVDPALQRVPPVPGDDIRVLLQHGNAQPGAENRAAFAKALSLVPQTESVAVGSRVIVSRSVDHPGMCRAAYEDAWAYNWALGCPVGPV
ncbi:MAG: hypothetical protein KC731_28375 [Myxococcales bacterium]|nr:hypothetical protein [Myxococcales bacterium]